MLKKAQGVLVLKGLAGKWACRICSASFKLKYPSNPLIYHDNTKVDILLWYSGTYVLWCYVPVIWCICCTFGEADAKIPDLKLRKEIAPEAGHQGSWLQWLSQTDWNSSCCACLHSLQPSFVVGHQFWTVQVGDRPKLFDRYLEQQVPLSTCCKHMLWCILGALVEL